MPLFCGGILSLHGTQVFYMPFVTSFVRRVRQEANQSDFERWQQEGWRRDEITDQSERLASPMVNTFDYGLTRDGSLITDLGEPMRPVFEIGLQNAERQAQIDPRWQFELERRKIELEEFEKVELYAQELGEGVRITSLSLDGSDYEGMRAIAEMLGQPLPQDYPGSEAMLANRMWTEEGLVVLSPIPDAVRMDGVDIGGYNKHRKKMIVRVMTAQDTPLGEHTELINRIRSAYDNVLTARTGVDHYAGRTQMSNQDARSFIEHENQRDLLDAHMAIIGRIFDAQKDPAVRNQLAAPHRYNFAAALDDRLNGKQVDSLSSSGDNARAEGREFDGDCPPAGTATTAGEQAGRLGYSVEKWSNGICRNCERPTQVWKVEDGGCSVCKDCATAHTWHGEAGLAQERQKAIKERQREAHRLERVRKAAQETVSRVIKWPSKKQDEQEVVERLGIGGMVTEEVKKA